MLKKVLIGAIGSVVVVAGCATGGRLAAGYIGQHMTVQIDREIPFPDELTLEGFDLGDQSQAASFANEIFGKLAGVTLKRRVSDMIARSSEPYAEILTDSFRNKLRERRIFGAVVDQGGDVTLRLKVDRYGVMARNGDYTDVKPVLDLKAQLVVPVVGVVWENTFDVPEYSTQTLRTGVEKLLNGESLFRDLFRSASEEAADELVRRMR